MWLQTRSTLYAGVISCSLHITLLGIAAATLISLPSQSPPQLRVTLLQRAAPLPTQEPPKGAAETLVKPAPQVMRPEPPRPKPVVQKKPTLVAPRRLSKPAILPKRLPPQESPPVIKEEEPQIALSPPPLSNATVMDDTAVSTDGESPAAVNGERTSNDPVVTEKQTAAANRGGHGGGGGSDGAGTGETTGPSATPDYNINPKPPYPLIARRIGAQGEVLLRVLVRQDGTVATVELARSSGFSLLDESAARTVRDAWRFVPARLDGTPVESWVEVPIKFVLADS